MDTILNTTFSVTDKEAVSPDGDSTTAPPSQASEHSEINSKQSSTGRHPIDAALDHPQIVNNNKIKVQPEKVPAAANNHHTTESINKQHHKQQTVAELNFCNSNRNEDESATRERNKIESPTGSYDSNNSNVPGQITSTDVSRIKKVQMDLYPCATIIMRLLR